MGVIMCVPSLLSHSYTNNQDQQLDEFLQYESEEWSSTNREDDYSPDGISDDNIGVEVVHGENVANML